MTTVVANTLAFDLPVAFATPGIQTRQRSCVTGAAQKVHSRRDDVVAPDLRHFVRVRRAAQVLQQRCVEHIADLRLGAAEDSSEARRYQAALQRLL